MVVIYNAAKQLSENADQLVVNELAALQARLF
jgi:hypothetical protein